MTTNEPQSGPAPEPQFPGQPQYFGEPQYSEQPQYSGQPQYSEQPQYSGQPHYDPYTSYAGPQPHQYPSYAPNLGYAPYAGYGDYPGYGEYAPPAAPPRHKRGWRLGAGIAALTAAALVGGIAIGDAVGGDPSTLAGSGSAGSGSTGSGSGGSDSGGSGGGVITPQIPGGSDGSGNGGGLDPNIGGGTSTSATLANGKQKTGVVTIVSTLSYQNAQSAGTGMVLSSNGEVLTNNHVVNGATSIVVTVVSTGKSYKADVVGTAPSRDVAVVKLRNASGLKTANIGDGDVSVGDKVVGVGNAGGTGTLRASSGKVTAVNQTITAGDDSSGTNSEKLSGLIEVDAAIISGDSGGPLYDASGKVVGMDTAASANPTAAQAYAIRIDDAVGLADQIENGQESSTIHIGLPAFIGVSIAAASSNGATVASLLDGGPAAAAGITAGSVITRVGDTAVGSGDALKSALQKYSPGDKVKITWTDGAGTSHSATVTLASGPAD